VALSALRQVLRIRLMAATTAMLTVVSVGFLAPAQPASAATYQSIAGAGSTWAQSAITQWTADVAAAGLVVNYAGVGSTAGRNDFRNGAVNFAASEIPYGIHDGNSFDPPPTRGYAYMPDVAGGLAFMYNLVIGGQRVTNLRLSGAVIAGIFTGQITMWNDPKIAADNPGLALPDISIISVVRSDGSGDTREFTQWMAATQGPYWAAYCGLVGRNPCTPTSGYPSDPEDPLMLSQSGDTGVAAYVTQPSSNGAIGYVPYSQALAAGFPVAKVLNAAGYYTLPTAGNVGVSLLAAQINENQSDPLYLTADLSGVYTDTDPRTYELSFYSYLIVPTDMSLPLTATQGYSLSAFGSFLLCQGQQQVDNLGYSALPINLVEDGYTQLQKIPGASVPATTSAFIQECNNPTFSPDGTDKLASSDPVPSACDQQGPVQCPGITNGAVGTITAVTASPHLAIAGQAVTLTATVTEPSGSITPAGSVQFEIGNTLIGSPVDLDSSGVGTTIATFTMAGTQVMWAQFTPTDPTAFSPSIGSISLTVLPTLDVVGETLTTTVPPVGAFTLMATTGATIPMTVSGGSATGTMVPITVTDSRNTYPGWSVVGQVTDFTNVASIPVGDIPASQLGWAPTTTGLAIGTQLGGDVLPANPGLGATGTVLAFAPAGGGFGASELSANLTLLIPSKAPSGPYTSTLTLTANPVAP
jgi:phosphate ABC transporter phosphate-binding protein